MKSLSLLAALSLCCAPAYAESDQALRLGYKAALLALAAGGEGAQVPPVQAAPVQAPFTEIERRALSLQLKVLVDETREFRVRAGALKNTGDFPPGPHDKDIRAALYAVIDATPAESKSFSDRDVLSINAMIQLGRIAARSNEEVKGEVVESLGKVLSKSGLYFQHYKDARDVLTKIAEETPELADRALDQLIKTVNSKAPQDSKEAALTAALAVARRDKRQAAEPGPDKTFLWGMRNLGMRLALNEVIDATPDRGVIFSRRDDMTRTAMRLLTDIAVRNEEAVTLVVVASLGKVFAMSRIHPDLYEYALSALSEIAAKRPECSDAVLTQLIKAVDQKISPSIKERAMQGAVSIAKERGKQLAADPVPGPVKLERIP